MNKKIIDISEADALYFVYISYEVDGYRLLVKLFDREEDKIKLNELSEELYAIALILIEKYMADDDVHEFNISVSASSNKMEIEYV